MTRLEFLQELINRCNYQRFLEIGTHKGKTFLPLVCKYKIAVDPSFRISPIFLVKWIIKEPSNLTNRYFWMTSSDFFQRKQTYLQKRGKQDLIFIDGLHTFEASLNDVLNSLKHLNREGVIVLHDCFPPNKAAATPANSLEEAREKQISGWTGTWCGDVWKTIAYLRSSFSQSLDSFVFNTDMGLGIVKFRKSVHSDFTINLEWFQKIDSMGYDELISDPQKIIGLTEKEEITPFFKQVQSKMSK